MPVTLFASIDGAISAGGEQATIPVTDEGLLRGDGVFEVVKLYGGRPFGLAAHIDRLEASAEAIELPIDRERLETHIEALLATAEPGDAALRLVWTRGGHDLVLIEELPARAGSATLAAVTYQVNPILEGVKSLSYAANMQATRIARSRGADEALFVDPAGTVLEAPTAAIFWAADGKLRTPALGEGILASITRQAIVDAIEVEEGAFALDQLSGADEAFLASTTREVHPVSALDGTPFGEVGGPLTRQAAEALAAAISAELGT